MKPAWPSEPQARPHDETAFPLTDDPWTPAKATTGEGVQDSDRGAEIQRQQVNLAT
jgi:hypothetical protein